MMTSHPLRVIALAAGLAAGTALGGLPAWAATPVATTAPQPAVQAPAAGPSATNAGASAAVAKLDDGLLSVMKNADKLGYDGRFAALQPIVASSFDVPTMTRIAVGSAWTSFSSDQQAALTDAFRRFITATYARRFDGYAGERFDLKGEHPSGVGVLVSTELVRPSDGPVALNYLVRQTDGQWRVVDVFLTGTISELATRRSEFASVLARNGYEGLKTLLESKAMQMASAAP